jgi:hypothetical protein
MKLMRVAVLLCSLAYMSGSSAWASLVNFGYGVSGGSACGNVLQSSAIIGAGACGAPACGYFPPATDAFAPLWQQAVHDRWNTGFNVNSGLYASESPLAFSGAGLAQGYGLGFGLNRGFGLGLGLNTLNQAAVVDNGLLNTGSVINQPLYLESPNAVDATLLQGGGACAQTQPAVVEQQAAPEAKPETTTTVTKKKTTTTTMYRLIQPRVIKKHHCLPRTILK